jgi:hypothetical protein
MNEDATEHFQTQVARVIGVAEGDALHEGLPRQLAGMTGKREMLEVRDGASVADHLL